ncbi:MULTISPECIES: genetic competence negative regulator [Metabacillus]|jgi:adapter protein MecA 1/2|uniref:Adapter protein MecA n=1 Tax=Metabacillus rhizolycopersici TaxID=2875709 RepID=A0ABS7UXU9_9BACI|nr:MULTISPECIES: genetic competence negative regulator [Metabacillus]MBZ5752807.1 genetic competence negative regulator [Metabacillus rhizolycopersici]MCM3652150.1 genetic competence negative regulator [Metabacillus litoralis]
MRLERLNYDKIKIFITTDDLKDRGLTKEDLWKDSLKVHQLFRDMMNEASVELGFEAHGQIAVEVYSLHAQGMVVIVTNSQEIDEMDDDFSDDYIEMQVKLDESLDVIYEYETFEDIIQLANCLYQQEVLDGMIIFYQERYYLLLSDDQQVELDTLVAILAEYGSPSTLTVHRLKEYGKMIIEEKAIQDIYFHFWKNKNDL